MSIVEKCAVIGVGETKYERGSSKSSTQLQLEASLAAIRDAGLEPRDIDGLIPIGITGATAEELVVNFGIPDLRYSALIPHGGASGIGAIQAAVAAVASGVCNNVLVSCGRNVTSGAKAGARIHTMPQFRYVTEFELDSGAIAPVQLYAPMARLHMEKYGTKSEQFGEIAITMRKHASLNQNAIMKKPMSLSDHQASRMISDPFRLFDCSLESDGGAAFIISSAERAADAPHAPVTIMGVGMGHPDSPGSITQRPVLTRVGVAKAAPRVFEMAGVKHADIDVAEIYDCFTYVVLCQIEDLGFCAKGEGGSFVENGRLSLSGELPTNTHGGLLSQGHMLGINHIVELVRQLRHEGGAAQVANAEVGLVTGYGDMGDGGVAIMRRG